MKVTVPVGERRPLTISFTAPQQLKAGSIVALGLTEIVTGTITGVLKGGIPPPAAASGKSIKLNISSSMCNS